MAERRVTVTKNPMRLADLGKDRLVSALRLCEDIF
jgi:hypothetical protein